MEQRGEADGIASIFLWIKISLQKQCLCSF